MSFLTTKRGIAIMLCTFAVMSIFAFNYPTEETPEPFKISSENLVEIKEDVQLDSYGYNRLNVRVTEGKVRRNESLYLILQDLDVSPQKIYQISNKAKGVFQSNRLKPGQEFLTYHNEGKAQRLILHVNPLDYIVFDWSDDVEVTTGSKEITTKIAQASGVINSSLYETLMDQENVSVLLGYRLSEIFAWQIDFFRLYPGDHFKVIYEEEYVDDQFYGIGKIVAAEFTTNERTYDAFHFENEKISGYYDSEGKGVQKALLKAPFKYSQRVSSNFSHSRFHPVLKRRIPHYGVDYAAPLGTPVLATGSGEVIEAQYRGANGNIVKIRHNGTYTTAYLHLNGFADGIRPGKRVKQGEVIGYVGRTGRVTGVHLDYRIYRNNQPVNPLKIDLPPSKAIDEEYIKEYKSKVNRLKEELSAINMDQESVVAAL